MTSNLLEPPFLTGRKRSSISSINHFNHQKIIHNQNNNNLKQNNSSYENNTELMDSLSPSRLNLSFIVNDLANYHQKMSNFPIFNENSNSVQPASSHNDLDKCSSKTTLLNSSLLNSSPTDLINSHLLDKSLKNISNSFYSTPNSKINSSVYNNLSGKKSTPPNCKQRRHNDEFITREKRRNEYTPEHDQDHCNNDNDYIDCNDISMNASNDSLSEDRGIKTKNLPFSVLSLTANHANNNVAHQNQMNTFNINEQLSKLQSIQASMKMLNNNNYENQGFPSLLSSSMSEMNTNYNNNHDGTTPSLSNINDFAEFMNSLLKAKINHLKTNQSSLLECNEMKILNDMFTNGSMNRTDDCIQKNANNSSSPTALNITTTTATTTTTENATTPKSVATNTTEMSNSSNGNNSNNNSNDNTINNTILENLIACAQLPLNLHLNGTNSNSNNHRLDFKMDLPTDKQMNLNRSHEDQSNNQYPDIQKTLFNEMPLSSTSSHLKSNTILWEYLLSRLQTNSQEFNNFALPKLSTPPITSTVSSSSTQNSISATHNHHLLANDLINSANLLNLSNYQCSTENANTDMKNILLNYAHLKGNESSLKLPINGTTNMHVTTNNHGSSNSSSNHNTTTNNSSILTDTLDTNRNDSTINSNHTANMNNPFDQINKLSQSEFVYNYLKKFQTLGNDSNGLVNDGDELHGNSNNSSNSNNNDNNINNNNNSSDNGIPQQMMQYYALCAFVQAASLLSSSSSSSSSSTSTSTSTSSSTST
ncbi:unnamed protein product [Trichobilharzia szidati]|nr:unnamed protein product [Trichobilharzia szidati]